MITKMFKNNTLLHNQKNKINIEDVWQVVQEQSTNLQI